MIGGKMMPEMNGLGDEQHTCREKNLLMTKGKAKSRQSVVFIMGNP